MSNTDRLLKFAVKYPGWNSCGKDSRRAMSSLEARGLLEVKRYGRGVDPQFRLALPEWAQTAIDGVA